MDVVSAGIEVVGSATVVIEVEGNEEVEEVVAVDEVHGEEKSRTWRRLKR